MVGDEQPAFRHRPAEADGAAVNPDVSLAGAMQPRGARGRAVFLGRESRREDVIAENDNDFKQEPN